MKSLTRSFMKDLLRTINLEISLKALMFNDKFESFIYFILEQRDTYIVIRNKLRLRTYRSPSSVFKRATNININR